MALEMRTGIRPRFGADAIAALPSPTPTPGTETVAAKIPSANQRSS